MGIENLYLDYGVDIAPSNHKHYREGWVNVPCPYCTGNAGYHLGFNTFGKYYSCFRCEGKPLVGTIAKLINVPWSKAEELVLTYKLFSSSSQKEYEGKLTKIGTEKFRYPTDTHPMQSHHRKYLMGRNFNPKKLERIYGLQGTGPFSRIKLNSKDKDIVLKTSWRVLIPIYWQGSIVSWQLRDITGRQEKKYIVCPMEYERVHHKFILYCLGGVLPKGGIGIWVEGVFDVHRVGPLAFSTFGITYTQEQLELIIRHFRRVYIWMDPDPQATRQAKKAEAYLRSHGVETCIIYTESDPADFQQEEVDELLFTLKLK